MKWLNHLIIFQMNLLMWVKSQLALERGGELSKDLGMFVALPCSTTPMSVREILASKVEHQQKHLLEEKNSNGEAQLTKSRQKSSHTDGNNDDDETTSSGF
jgi:hypothetical protein